MRRKYGRFTVTLSLIQHKGYVFRIKIKYLYKSWLEAVEELDVLETPSNEDCEHVGIPASQWVHNSKSRLLWQEEIGPLLLLLL